MVFSPGRRCPCLSLSKTCRSSMELLHRQASEAVDTRSLPRFRAFGVPEAGLSVWRAIGSGPGSSPRLCIGEEGPYDKCKDYELHGSGKDPACLAWDRSF